MTFEAEARQLMTVEMTQQQIMTREEEASDEHARVKHAHHDRGLLLIGLFKLGKAVLFFCLGLGAVHLLHKDIADEVLKLAAMLKVDPESKLVSLALDHIDLIDAHRLKEIGFATFGYSALALTEGTGLLLEKVWAEYLTLGLTISFLPWELYELARRPNWFRLGLLLINLAVLWYLLWLLRRKRTAEEPVA